MELKELKELAKSNGLEFAKNATRDQVKALLDAAEIPYNDEPMPRDFQLEAIESEVKKNNYTSSEYDIDELISEYKMAESSIDIKRADQKRAVIKKKIAEDKEALKKLLIWERRRGIISVSDDYLLNEIEESECTKVCECTNRIPSGGSFAEEGQEYKYKSYYDESRNKEVFVVFVKREIAPEDQISKELAWKMSQGFMPTMDDYAPAKTQVRRVAMVESEFNKYFKIEI
jgi:hypothetical protein